jgi:Fe-S-cluster containining protein
LVPISPPEALRLRATIAGLEPEHRQRVLERFRAAAQRLDQAGLAAALRPGLRADSGAGSDRRALGLAYFALGLACPFLEAESCSIHAERPLACREYLVSSDPSHCAQPAAATTIVLELPRRLSVIFAQLCAQLRADRSPPLPTWLALIQALDETLCADAAVTDPRFPGGELFEQLIARLAAP